MLRDVDEPRTLRMVGVVLRSAARIAAIEQGDVRLHFSRNPGAVRVWVTEASTDLPAMRNDTFPLGGIRQGMISKLAEACWM